MTTTPAPHEHTLDLPGATLAWQVRGDLATCTPEHPALLMAGSPMDSTGFTTLSGYFTDRVVVTYDPRNTGRSTRDDPTATVTTAQHAADLGALLTALDGPPVDLFGSSGGASNALTLVAQQPDLVRTLVAHEPPMAGVLPDREVVAAVTADMVATYDRAGLGPAMAKFIAFVMHRGPVGPEYLEAPAPDPAAFGLPTKDDGTRDDAMMANLRGGADTVPDAAALTAATTRVVVGVGEECGGPDDGEMPARCAYAVAAMLGQEATVFPSHHAGFLGGEFGQQGKPEEFAARLREVLGYR